MFFSNFFTVATKTFKGTCVVCIIFHIVSLDSAGLEGWFLETWLKDFLFLEASRPLQLKETFPIGILFQKPLTCHISSSFCSKFIGVHLNSPTRFQRSSRTHCRALSLPHKPVILLIRQWMNKFRWGRFLCWLTAECHRTGVRAEFGSPDPGSRGLADLWELFTGWEKLFPRWR